MFAIGHFALGYLTGKTSSLAVKTNLNMPLLLLTSIIPDIDLILEAFYRNLFVHRIETHSIVTYTIIMIPFFILYRKKAIPYFVVLLSHSLIGDFFTGGVGLFWPFTSQIYGIQTIDVTSIISLSTEFILFAISLPLMVYSKDLQSLIKPNKKTLMLIIPFFAVLGPALQIERQMGTESSLPVVLLIPSLFWLVIFAYAGLRWLLAFLRKVF